MARTKSKGKKTKVKKTKAKKTVKKGRAAGAKKAARKTAAKRAKAPARKTARKTKKAARATNRAIRKAVRKTGRKGTRRTRVEGEGSYTASRNFRRKEENFVKKNQGKIEGMAKEAEAALEGPEGAELQAAEESTKAEGDGME